MKTIHKFPVPWPPAEDNFEMELSKDAEILTLDLQHGLPMLWAMVDADAPMVKGKFRVVGTGHPIHEKLSGKDYIGTFQLRNGALVMHLFRMPE